MKCLIQFKGLYLKEVIRYLKIPTQSLFAPLISAILYILIFGIGLGRSIPSFTKISYLSFLITGLITMSVVRSAFENSMGSLIVSKYFNDLQDLRVSPLSNSQLVWTKGLASLTRGFCVAFLIYFTGQTFLFLLGDPHLFISHPFIFFYFLFFGGLAFAFLGIACGMRAKNFENMHTLNSLILLPLTYLGGVFFRISALPIFFQKISLLNPFFYVVNGVRFGILSHSDINIKVSLVVTFFFFLLSYFFAWKSFQKGTNFLR